MARRLDCLVPIYDEGQETIKPLLDSIAIQQRVDFDDIGVIVCCDGGPTILTDDFMSQYSYHIEFHMCDHEGVSATRNKCFEYSNSEYLMYCDCDDLFSDVCGMYLIFKEMDAETSPQDMMMYGLTVPERGFDVLISCFREETRGPDGQFTFVNHDQLDLTFCHGKCYRRQYLLDNNLKFNKNLYIHEDSFFNILARECAKPYRAKWCPMPFYLWKWRTDSICRRDELYIQKTMPDMIKSNSAVVDEFIRRAMTDKAAQYFAMHVFDVYYMLNKPEWLTVGSSEYRNKVEHDFANHFKRHKQLWDDMPSQQKMMISQGVRQRSVMEGMLMEAITVEDWLKKILALAE